MIVITMHDSYKLCVSAATAYDFIMYAYERSRTLGNLVSAKELNFTKELTM